MTYDEFLDHLFGLGRFGIKPGLDRIKTLLAHLGNPHDKLSAVHIVGTNGKGSTAAFLSSILTNAGYRTGLFTSPHLITFSERIRVDGMEISETDVLRIGLKVMDAAPAGTTFFEIVTAMALVYFQEQQVDIVILEAGMGGGSDATACVPGCLTVITPISMDHSEYLGETVAAIAGEKAAIIPEGSIVVSSAQPDEAFTVLAEECRACGAELIIAGSDYRFGRNSRGIFYRSGECRLEGVASGLPGRYQAENAGTAIAAAEALGKVGYPVPEHAVTSGIATASWPGRMEKFSGQPMIILDGAHNPAGAAALAAELRELPAQRLVAVLGVMSDKDLEGILSPVTEIFSSYVAAEPSVGRAQSSEELAARLQSLGLSAVSGGSVARSLETARISAGEEGVVIVFGSLYLVGEARAYILGRHYRGIRG